MIEGQALSVEFNDLYMTPVEPALCTTDYFFCEPAIYSDGLYVVESQRPYYRRDNGFRRFSIESLSGFDAGAFVFIDEQNQAFDAVYRSSRRADTMIGETDQQVVDAVRCMLRKIRWGVGVGVQDYV